MVSPYLKEEEMLQIKDFKLPLVLIGCRVDDPSVDYVDSDNVKAVAEVVDHLGKGGHKENRVYHGGSGRYRAMRVRTV